MNPPEAKKHKLLIVEDDFYVRDTYVLHGKLMEFDVITAVDGEEALEKIRSIELDIVLLDMMLPKIDGMSVLRTVKADPQYAALKIIVITNLDDMKVKEEAKQLGALDFLLKMEYPPHEMLEITKKYLQ